MRPSGRTGAAEGVAMYSWCQEWVCLVWPVLHPPAQRVLKNVSTLFGKSTPTVHNHPLYSDLVHLSTFNPCFCNQLTCDHTVKKSFIPNMVLMPARQHAHIDIIYTYMRSSWTLHCTWTSEIVLRRNSVCEQIQYPTEKEWLQGLHIYFNLKHH